MKRSVWMGFLTVAVVATLTLLPAASRAQRSRSALDEPPRPRRPADEPRPEPVVLRFIHIPAESFVETLAQLADNEHLGEALSQMPKAFNRPANAVVLIVPPDMADLLREIAEQLDQPNEFLAGEREREREEMGFRLEMEQHQRAMAREDMAMRSQMGPAGPRRMGPQAMPQAGRGPGLMRRGRQGPMAAPMPGRMGPGQGGPRRGPMARMGPGPQGLQPGMPPMMGPGRQGQPPADREAMERKQRERMMQMQREREEMQRGEGEEQERAMRLKKEQMQREREEMRRGEGEEQERAMRREKEEMQREREEMRRGEGEEQERAMRREKEEMQREREEMRRGEGEEQERAMRLKKEQMQREREEMRRGEGEEQERAMRLKKEQVQREREEMRRGEGEEQERAMRLKKERVQREREETRPPRDEPREDERLPGGGLGGLLSPRFREALGLSDGQVEKIRGIQAEAREKAMRLAERVRNAVREAPPEQRAERMRDMMGQVRQQRIELMRQVRDRVLDVLNPDQREKAERLLREDSPGPPREPQRPEPLRRGARRGGQNRPAVADQPPEFRLIQGRPDAAARPGRGARAGGGWGAGVDEATRREWLAQAQTRSLFQLLADEDLRAELDLSAEQEARIAAAQEKYKKTRDRIQDDVRLRFGSDADEAPGLTPGPRGAGPEVRRATGQALRDAQPQLDEIMQEATGALTDDQKAKFQEVMRERSRLVAACGSLWILATRKAKQELALADDVAATIKKLLDGAADRYDQDRKTAVDALREKPQDQQREAWRATSQALTKQRQEAIEKTRGLIFGLLTADQKPKAEKLVAEAGQRSPQRNGMRQFGGPGGGGMRSGSAPRPAAPAGRALYEAPARFHLVAENAGPSANGPPPDDRRTAGFALMLLADPEVRTELKMTDEQQTRVLNLQEQAMGLRDRIRSDIRGMMGEVPQQDLTEEERRLLRQEMMEAVRAVIGDARQEIEAMVAEAQNILTPDQHEQLRTIGRTRMQTLRTTRGLSILLTPMARKELGLTDEQVEKIRAIINEATEQVREMRKTAGPDADSGPKADQLKRLEEDLMAKARRRIMALLTPEQRVKAEALLDNPRPQAIDRVMRPAGPPKAAPATKGAPQGA